MWKNKYSDKVLYIDIESDLEIQPNRIMDCTNTDFADKQFHTIFFDPPHIWGETVGENIYACRNRKERDALLEKRGYENRGGIAYYGIDKYRTKQELTKFVSDAQKEFYRILQDDGCLWFRWSEWRIPLKEILQCFKAWNILLHIKEESNSKLKRATSNSKKHWLMLVKNDQSMIVGGILPQNDS